MPEQCSGELDDVSSIILAVLHSISGIMSVAGNLVVLISVYHTPTLHTVSNYYIASLAVGDFLVGIIICPLWVTKSVLNIWENQHPLTVAAELMSTQTLITTTFNLAAVSLDRYLAITNAFFYLEIMTLFRCYVSIAFIWLFSVAFACLRLIVTDPVDLPKLWIAVAIVGYTLPFVLISYSYYNIYKAARYQHRRIQAEARTVSIVNETCPSNDSSITERKRNRKAANTIGIIIGIYLFLAFPSMVIVGIQLITTDNCLKIRIIRVWFWGALFSFSSSAANPWIYAVRNRDYREAFKRVFNCLFTNRRKVNDNTVRTTQNNTQVIELPSSR